MGKRGVVLFLLCCVVMAFVTTMSYADVESVRAIPWQGDTNKFHTALSADTGGAVDPLDAWDATSDNVLRVVYSGSSYVSWVSALVNAGGASTTYCVFERAGSNGCTETYLCNTSYSSAGFDASVTIPAGPRPDSIQIQSLTTCDTGQFEIRLNDTLLGYVQANQSGNCTCSPGVETDTPSLSTGADLSNTLLKGVITTTDTAPVWYRWVFGDGSQSGVQQLSGATRYNVEAQHQYDAAPETPFTAQLMVDGVDSSMANAVSDNYLIMIQEDGLDARVNIVIDNGLWYLYKNKMQDAGVLSLAAEPVAAWASYDNYYPSSTAVAIQAFEINGHKETGNFSEDPYAEDVAAGLNWLLNGSYSGTPVLSSIALPVANSNGVDADTNGNGVGVQVHYPRYPAYQGGMIMDAIISAGTPDADSGRDFDGDGNTDTYQQIIQDMVDAYAWGQADGGAASTHATGWGYNWNEWATDNSTNQWAAIGLIPAVTTVAHRQPGPDGLLNTADDIIVDYWATIPAFVRESMDLSLTYTYSAANRWFGYRSATPLSNVPAVSRPSGMVQMQFAFPDTYASDERWTGPESWYAENFDAAFSPGQRSYYGWLSFVKAMLISNTELLSNGLNWYRGSETTMGLAERLVNEHEADGSWPQGGQVSHPGYYGDVFVTGWAIQMLKPALFVTAPIPCFTASPNPTYENRDIAFDPSCSDHSDPGKNINNIVLFEWDFNNDGVYDASSAGPDVQHHAFSCADLPCTYPVVLRVTDDEGTTATFSLDVNITNPPHPPEANAGGPYIVSLCENDVLMLDGSLSFEPNAGEHEAGCASCPDDLITAWDWDLTSPLTGFNDVSGETVTLAAAEIASFFVATGPQKIGLRVTDNTAASYPSSGDPNLTNVDFADIEVYAACADCTLDAQIGCESVIISWDGDGDFDVYRSTQGPNTGFALVASINGSSYEDTAVVSGTTYYYRVRGDNCMSASANITYAYDPSLCELPVCIEDLAAIAKSRKVELNWTCQADAQCYNVYRSTSPDVDAVPGNMVADCHTTTFCAYTDRSVSNGTTYYYKVTKVLNGEEVCISVEASATPVDDRTRTR